MSIPLRTDFDSSALRSYAKKTKGGPQARRLLALAAVYAGATRTEAARISAPPPPISSAPSAPKQGKGAALILPSSNIEAMNLHLAEIATEVAPGALAVLLVDQAGRRLPDRLNVPANITLVPLPPKCPELNPTENIWPFMRDNWISNCVFHSCDDIVDHCCQGWNKLIDQPWRIMSIGMSWY